MQLPGAGELLWSIHTRPTYVATISEPLRHLTKTGMPFVFGKEQKEAIVELKKCLSNSESLGYFNKDAPTQVIADASPVGLGAVLTQMSKMDQELSVMQAEV